MPIYLYKGYDAKTGAASKGKIEADTVKQAKQLLRSKKIIPAELKEELKASSSSLLNRLQQKAVTPVDLGIMTRQFATLQSAHVPLDECLKALTEQVDNVLLRNTLSSVRESISEGKSLGDSLARYPQIFKTFYVSMVKAGEASGKLGLVLDRLADFLEYQVTITGKVKSAMAYPAIMILVSLGVVGYLFTSVVPQLADIFKKQEGLELPWYTEVVMVLSDFIVNSWYLVFAGVALVVLLFKAWHRSEKGRLSFDRFCLKAPIVSALVTRINISKFTKTLSTLLNSGVPIMASLEITKNVLNNKVLASVVADAKLAVQEGKTLASVLGKSEYFPPLVSHMIKTGEKTGELESMLEHVAKAYDAEVERRIDSMISLIEPLMIVLLGFIVVVVVFAVMVPMLSIGDYQ